MSLADVLQERLIHFKGFRDEWESFLGELIDVLGEVAVAKLKLDADQTELAEALATFADEVAAPTIVIAVVGTTSAGKSSLVNFLCGADVTPVAAQEMSAGVVRIEHIDGAPTLIIDETQGATWTSGTFEGLSATEIGSRLREVCRSYRAGTEVAPPLATVRLPLRVGPAEVLGLPAAARLRILDLPGLADVGDEANSSVVQDEVKKGLCIVVANAEATGEERERALIEQVVQQVKDLRGSPARMIFVANRIDAFLRNDHAEDERQRWLDRVRDRVQKALHGALPEHRADIDAIKLLPFSSRAAQLANALLRTSATSDVDPIAELDKNFGMLIPDELLNKLPRPAERATPTQRRAVGERVAQISGAVDFDDHLRRHLAQHLPALLLPQLVLAVREPLCRLLSSTTLELRTRIDSAERTLTDNLKKNDKAATELEELRKQMERSLAPLFTPSSANSKRADELNEKLEKLADELRLGRDDRGKLEALSDWKGNLNKERTKIFGAVRASLSKGTSLSLPELSKKNVGALENAIKALGDCDYKTDGGKKRYDDNKAPRALIKALGCFVGALGRTLCDALNNEGRTQSARVADALQHLLSKQQAALREKACVISPELAVILPEKRFKAGDGPRFELDLHYDFEDIDRKDRRYSERVRRGGFFGSIWDFFDRGRLEERVETYYELDVPSLDDLLGSFEEQIHENNEIEDAYFKWLQDRLQQYQQDVKDTHETHHKKTKEKLQELAQEQRVDHAKRTTRLNTLFSKATTLAERIGGEHGFA